MADFEVFISHRSEDQEIAKELGYALEALSRNALRINISEEIQGGIEWRDWIERRVASSHFLIFLYTDAQADWRWCLYELGLFRGKAQDRRLVCIKDPDIQDLPPPIENLQCYDADEAGLRKFFTDAISGGAFTGQPLNVDIHTNSRLREDFERYLKAVIKRFVPMSRFELFADRIVVTVSRTTGDRIETLDEPLISGTESAMRLVGLSFEEGAPWSKLYKLFHERGESAWLDELQGSIESLRNRDSATDVMSPFTTFDGRRVIPVLGRFDTFRVRLENRVEPRCLFVIFVEPPAAERPTTVLRDMGQIFEQWDMDSPTSIVRVKWRAKSTPVQYEATDLDGAPIIYAANASFLELFDFKRLPDPLREEPLTAAKLMDLVKDYIEEDHMKALAEDQARVSQRIVFENREGRARAPLTFNRRHPRFPGESFLPSVVAKQIVGDTKGPHVMYLMVNYPKDFWPLDHPQSPFFKATQS